MVSRQETARPLLTPGEIMQLPPHEEIVMVAGTPPIRAIKAKYFEDARLQERIVAPPELVATPANALATNDWSCRVVAAAGPAGAAGGSDDGVDPANAGIRREPELPEQEEILPPPPSPAQEFEFLDDEPDVDAAKANAMRARMGMTARQASLDPGDGIEL
jgi:type IV secretion system protein VirD4